MSRLYKVLNADGSCIYGVGHWSLPTADGPGEWMPPVAPLIPCESGYHLCREDDLIAWLGPVIYEAEYRGPVVEGQDKIVVAEARLLRRLDTWNETTARLFAADCAERVAYLDTTGTAASTIEVARRFAAGKATREELAAACAAAGDAAGDATGDAWAAWDAARDAAWAARDAAWDAARDAAGDAAGDAWAAWDAARAAAWAARDAAGDAWAAVRDAAWAAWAAGDAARAWQKARLHHYLYPVAE